MYTHLSFRFDRLIRHFNRYLGNQATAYIVERIKLSGLGANGLLISRIVSFSVNRTVSTCHQLYARHSFLLILLCLLLLLLLLLQERIRGQE